MLEVEPIFLMGGRDDFNRVGHRPTFTAHIHLNDLGHYFGLVPYDIGVPVIDLHSGLLFLKQDFSINKALVWLYDNVESRLTGVTVGDAMRKECEVTLRALWPNIKLY